MLGFGECLMQCICFARRRAYPLNGTGASCSQSGLMIALDMNRIAQREADRDLQ
jgi:hypothetical protein